MADSTTTATATAGAAASTLGPIAGLATAALGAGQFIAGAIAAAKAKKLQKKLFAQRTGYQTPQELYDVVNLTKSQASEGYDPGTLQYLTGQTDQAFGSALGLGQRFGATPNDLSAIFDQKVNAIMKIGAVNHALNMENFSKYLGAASQLASSKTAEWQSQQDILKDQLVAAGVDFSNAKSNEQSGANAGIAGLAAFAQSLIGVDPKQKTKSPLPGIDTGWASGSASWLQ